MKPLGVVPTYVRSGLDLEMLVETLDSLRRTAGDDLDVLVIDDGSPDRDLAGAVQNTAERFYCEAHLKPRNEGFSRTVNVGLRRALQEGRDAVLINADIEFREAGFAEVGWLGLMQRQMRSDGSGLASVVGARLLYPNGLLQHAGVYFSLLTRDFDHIFRYGPGNLPEAQHVRIGPVTGALQFIRHECLKAVGVYDEDFRMAFEDVDYCVRTWLSGREVVYQPRIVATHHESVFRGPQRGDTKLAKWTAQSWDTFRRKWAHQNMAAFMPTIGVVV